MEFTDIVSIPFKRESASQQVTELRAHNFIGFPEVSIPFKRESASQLAQAKEEANRFGRKFPFPSNGIARLNATANRRINRNYSIGVSIPFKRDSASQRRRARIGRLAEGGSFHSLQTGERVSTRRLLHRRDCEDSVCFHSLQTG